MEMTTVSLLNTEIITSSSPPRAEGTSIKHGRENPKDFKPKESEIKQILEDRGWMTSEIEIWFDRLQGFWRWSCELHKGHIAMEHKDTVWVCDINKCKTVLKEFEGKRFKVHTLKRGKKTLYSNDTVNIDIFYKNGEFFFDSQMVLTKAFDPFFDLGFELKT